MGCPQIGSNFVFYWCYLYLLLYIFHLLLTTLIFFKIIFIILLTFLHGPISYISCKTPPCLNKRCCCCCCRCPIDRRLETSLVLRDKESRNCSVSKIQQGAKWQPKFLLIYLVSFKNALNLLSWTKFTALGTFPLSSKTVFGPGSFVFVAQYAWWCLLD